MVALCRALYLPAACVLVAAHVQRDIRDVCYCKWPATSRAEPVPSVGAAATLKHPKLPLLAATSIRCSSFGVCCFLGGFFVCRPSCEVRTGQRRRSPWQGTEGHWGQGESCLWGCQAALGWGIGSSCALISSKGLLTRDNHPAAHLVGVPEAASLQCT